MDEYDRGYIAGLVLKYGVVEVLQEAVTAAVNEEQHAHPILISKDPECP